MGQNASVRQPARRPAPPHHSLDPGPTLMQIADSIFQNDPQQIILNYYYHQR